jgi:SAM-dependent methyltransferase
MPPIHAPLFCLTSDTDWASEFALRDFLSTVTGYGIRPTIFATHASPVLTEFDERGDIEIGIHPNFLPGSSHGDDASSIIDELCRLFPRARTFRSHWFFEHTLIARELYARGFRYDSNLCLHMQPNLVPLQHNSGLVRFPVFWEDDVHWSGKTGWDLDRQVESFLSPGLKILSVHPFSFAANIPDQEYYAQVKSHIRTLDERTVDSVRFQGPGARTFLVALLERLTTRGERFHTLGDLHRMLPMQAGTSDASTTPGRQTAHTDDEYERYWKMTEAERQQFVKADFDQRNPTDPYATSRDYNAREMEIDSIRRELPPRGGRLVDLGCGNGYTLLSVGRELEGWDLLGVDFSEPLIAGAETMLSEQRTGLKSAPRFLCADAIEYVRRAAPASVDCVLTERFVQNLPSRDIQRQVLRHVYEMLAPGGRLLLCEGSEDGFDGLNDVRAAVGLARIPATSKDNVSAIRFRDHELETYAASIGFIPRAKLGYSTFFLMARVLYPLLIAPQAPRFDAPINDLARQIQQHVPYQPGYGSNVLWVFEKAAA